MTDAQEIRARTVVEGAISIDYDVPIEMDDGVVLRGDVYRSAAGGPHPVLLSHGVYAKGLDWETGAYGQQWRALVADHVDVLEGSSGRYQSWEVVDPEKWVPLGYVCVRIDSRGAGRSPGYLDPLGRRERDDLYQCIEWAAAQPWSSGKVGLAGISYFAINQWQVAALNPPHLAAICPWEGMADMYRDGCCHGGVPSAFWGRWQLMQVAGVQHGLGERGLRNPVNGELISGPPTLTDEELAANRIDLGQALRDHPLDDEFHRERSAELPEIRVPLLSAANWAGQGLHPRGNFSGFEQAATSDKWLEVHGLEHWTHFYTSYGLDLQRRFFDHFLKGEDNGWDRHPRVQLQIRHVDRFELRAEQEWPLARTQWTPLHLDAGARTLSWQPASDAGSAGFSALEDRLTFVTAPFEHEVEITGPLAAKLFASSSTSDADLFLVVHLLDPDGNEITFPGTVDPHTPIGQGWLRASHRALDPTRSRPHQPYHPHTTLEPLTPGEVYELDIEIWPTCIVVPPGHQLALSVRGTDYEYEGTLGERADLSTFANVMRGCGPFLHDDPATRPAEVYGGVTTVHTGPATPSHLLVPVIPR